MKADERGAGGVCVGHEGRGGLAIVELGPATVVALLAEQFLGCRRDFSSRSCSGFQGEEAEDPVLVVFSRRTDQPIADLGSAGTDTVGLLVRSKGGEAIKSQVACAERTGFGRWTIGTIQPMVLVFMS